MTHRILATLAAAALAITTASAQESEVELKLREALRDTMLKLRDAQAQVAAAQAAQIAAETQVKDLTAKNEALSKELVAERNVSANMISELTTKLEERGTVILTLQTSLENWKKSYSGATSLAAKKESERQKLQARVNELERIVEDQQFRNIEMYKAAMETVDRYKKFGLGDAVLAREPFVAAQRVKFQNIIQDQSDKLANARIRPPSQQQPTPPPANPAAEAGQPQAAAN
ncbi:MAG: hypothetical protein SFU53_11845 [Terrimicrobiaceae bacterium]|nr:hypothetical protein [Terrimicrobiaceae bacterium]